MKPQNKVGRFFHGLLIWLADWLFGCIICLITQL